MIRNFFTSLLMALGLIALPAPDFGSYADHVKWYDEVEDDAFEWRMYHHEAYDEYTLMFNDIFAEVQVKRSKNNRIMVKGINDKSFKFAKKGN